MLYAIAHFLRDKIPWLWDLVDLLNSALFQLRYGRKLRDLSLGLRDLSLGLRDESLELRDESLEVREGFKVVPMRDIPTGKLVEFFARQPEEAFKFFKPHGFDAKSIEKLQKNKAFLAYVLLDVSKLQDRSDSISSKLNTLSSDAIAGYCFNRSFFHGKGFRGRMVDINYRGKGLGTMMNRLLNEVGFGIGLRLFETVSKDNVASYRSAISASNVKVVEEMDDDELYLEIVKE